MPGCKREVALNKNCSSLYIHEAPDQYRLEEKLIYRFSGCALAAMLADEDSETVFCGATARSNADRDDLA